MTTDKHIRKSLRVSTLVMSVVCLASCGGSDDSSGAKCSVGTACGGDVVGTWQIQESCAYGNFVDAMDMCSSATVDGNALKVTGTMKFNADKTYTSNNVLNGTMKMTIPGSCLKGDDGETLTCSQYGALLTALATLGGSGSGELSADCSGSSTCVCSIKFKNAKSDDDGTYMTDGTKIKIATKDADEPETSDYCVQGTSLTLSQPSTAGSSGASSLRLTKK